MCSAATGRRCCGGGDGGCGGWGWRWGWGSSGEQCGGGGGEVGEHRYRHSTTEESSVRETLLPTSLQDCILLAMASAALMLAPFL
jgi:hypothetical protein